jgi:hypothetical protein
MCVGYDDHAACREATFFHDHQNKTAEVAYLIPFERLEELAARVWGIDPSFASPLLVFSIGRAGSTLLKKLLPAAGIACLSEPDVYTQYALMGSNAATLTGLTHLPQIIAYATSGLLHLCGSHRAALKFRNQHCSIADSLMETLPRANGLMLLRDAQSWAKSIHRAFSWDAGLAVDILESAHLAVHRCIEIERPLRVLHYENLCDQPVRFMQDIAEAYGVPASQVDIEQVQAVMAVDAQGDSQLARKKIGKRDVVDEFMREFDTLWNGKKKELTKKGVEILV